MTSPLGLLNHKKHYFIQTIRKQESPGSFALERNRCIEGQKILWEYCTQEQMSERLGSEIIDVWECQSRDEQYGCVPFLYINKEFSRRVYWESKVDPVCKNCV